MSTSLKRLYSVYLCYMLLDSQMLPSSNWWPVFSLIFIDNQWIHTLHT